MEPTRDPASEARALFKRFLADRWFGGPDFESWITLHREFEAQLRALRDEWLAELGDPESPGFHPPGERGARRATSFAQNEVIGGFRLVKRLGSGASGEVWEAQEMALGDRRVALKLLRPDLALDVRSLERFRREALALSLINHPNVVAVYSVGRPQGHRSSRRS
jgi:serine/threonine protein kinase